MSASDRQELDGVKVGVFVAQESTKEVEFTEPKAAMSDAGADVDVLGGDADDARTVNNDLDESDAYGVDKTFSEAAADECDGRIVPGGIVGADTLRADEDAVELLEHHRAADGALGSICHGPWTLVEAGVVDDSVVTSRDPDDLDAFTDAIVDEFAGATER
ncbi:DJ-1/PfpI family protein [Natronoarchaeum mannanilyticum]|uniref:Type 1 glutamine amidotransferase domain-containing protein n=1 Tax=Natronoarchaeum mannanilyticum TaxID=926360 RepID=A0AAV3TE46_9EURY